MTAAMIRLLRDLLAEGHAYSPMHTGGYRLPSGRNVRFNTLHSLRLLGLVERDETNPAPRPSRYVLTPEGRRVAGRAVVAEGGAS